jgi:hypothetical protein
MGCTPFTDHADKINISGISGRNIPLFFLCSGFFALREKKK